MAGSVLRTITALTLLPFVASPYSSPPSAVLRRYATTAVRSAKALRGCSAVLPTDMQPADITVYGSAWFLAQRGCAFIYCLCNIAFRDCFSKTLRVTHRPPSTSLTSHPHATPRAPGHLRLHACLAALLCVACPYAYLIALVRRDFRVAARHGAAAAASFRTAGVSTPAKPGGMGNDVAPGSSM